MWMGGGGRIILYIGMGEKYIWLLCQHWVGQFCLEDASLFLEGLHFWHWMQMLQVAVYDVFRTYPNKSGYMDKH